MRAGSRPGDLPRDLGGAYNRAGGSKPSRWQSGTLLSAQAVRTDGAPESAVAVGGPPGFFGVAAAEGHSELSPEHRLNTLCDLL